MENLKKYNSRFVVVGMINFMCQLEWDMGAQICAQRLFLGVSMKVFLEEISIWLSELSEAHGPYWCRWASSDLVSAQIEGQDGGRLNALSLPDYLGWDIDPLCFALLILGCSLQTTISGSQASELHPSLPGSLACRQHIVGLLRLHTCASQYLIRNPFIVNRVNLLYMYVMLVFLSGEPWLIQLCLNVVR